MAQLCTAEQFWCLSHLRINCIIFSFRVQVFFISCKSNIINDIDLFSIKKLSFDRNFYRQVKKKQKVYTNHIFCFEKVKHPIANSTPMIDFLSGNWSHQYHFHSFWKKKLKKKSQMSFGLILFHTLVMPEQTKE